MDRVGGCNVNNYFPWEVLAALHEHGNIFRDNKLMELFAGFIWANCLTKSEQIPFWVGLPLKSVERLASPKPGAGFDYLKKHPELVDDTDCDVVVSSVTPDPKYFYRCQVTRLVSDDIASRNKPDIFTLLSKKFRFPPDRRLTLLVNVEDNLSLSTETLSDFFKGYGELSFGSVVLLGQADDHKLAWRCFQVHPTLAESDVFTLGEWIPHFLPR